MLFTLEFMLHRNNINTDLKKKENIIYKCIHIRIYIYIEEHNHLSDIHRDEQ